MFKFNNSIVPNKVRIGWHFSSNKNAYRDAYSALKRMYYNNIKVCKSQGANHNMLNILQGGENIVSLPVQQLIVWSYEVVLSSKIPKNIPSTHDWEILHLSTTPPIRTWMWQSSTHGEVLT